MKKFLIIACMLLTSSITFAQKTENALGVQFGVGFFGKNATSAGAGFTFQHNFTDEWRGEAALDYWFKEGCIFDIRANVQYLLHVNNKVNIYPELGAVFAASHGIPGNNYTRFGFDIGIGGEYFINSQFKVFGDFTYQYLADIDAPILKVGVAYLF